MKCCNCQHQLKSHGPGYPIPAGFTACAKARVYESFSPVFERECGDFVQKVAV